MTLDLFADLPAVHSGPESLGPGAMLLRALAAPETVRLLCALESVTARAPFRCMTTPNGFRMSVAMTNCGSAGWVSGPHGYRYAHVDPDTGHAWPPMPRVYLDLAAAAAAAAGFGGFTPDACLINRYAPGTRLSLHQDKDERDFSAPIVSVSLGLPAVFLFGGATRRERPRRRKLPTGRCRNPFPRRRRTSRGRRSWISRTSMPTR